MTEQPLYGTLAEYPTADALRQAWQQVHDAGYQLVEYYAPFPLESLTEPPDRRLALMTLLGGVIGGVLAFAIQAWSAVVDYPYLVGGRPLFSWPAFVLVTFEMVVLFAAASAFFGMLVRNGLPQLNHPLFDARRFDLETRDRFFLLIGAEDERFDREQVRADLAATGAATIDEVAA